MPLEQATPRLPLRNEYLISDAGGLAEAGVRSYKLA